MKTFREYLIEKYGIDEANIVPIGMISSGEAQHGAETKEERKDHEIKMQNKFGVYTFYHEDGPNDTLSYHSPDISNVRRAIIHHYYNDLDTAKELHPHLFEKSKRTK